MTQQLAEAQRIENPQSLAEFDCWLADKLATFRNDPLGFVLFAYPWGEPGPLEQYAGPDDWQREILEEIGQDVRARAFDGITPCEPIKQAVASGHGIGKSVLVAWLTDWIMSTRPHARGTITASTFLQLDTKTWPCLQKWTNLCITSHWFTLTKDRMRVKVSPDTWFCSAQTCKEENSEAFAGQHAAESTSFYIFDEGSAVPDKIWEVAEGGLTDGEPMIFAFGNPTRREGKFHRICFGSERGRWRHRSIDSRTCKFTNKALLQQWIEDWGIDSDFVKVRVLGVPPSATLNQLIPADVVDACAQYKAQGYSNLPKIMAVDVARFGDDQSVIVMRQGRKVELLARLRGLDEVQVAGRVMEKIRERSPDAVVIDADGLGAGVFDQVKHHGFGKLFEFHGGSTPHDPTYFNRRAECWGLMRDALKTQMELPNDKDLLQDLSGPEYGFNNKQQLQLERKEDMKARGLASPDAGDALAMTFSVTIAPPRPRPSQPYRKYSVWS